MRAPGFGGRSHACAGMMPVTFSWQGGNYINVIVWLIVIPLIIVGYYCIIVSLYLHIAFLFLAVICPLDLEHIAVDYRH